MTALPSNQAGAAGAWLSVVVTLLAGAAHAQEQRELEVVAAGDPAAVEAMRGRVLSLERRMPVEVRFEQAESIDVAEVLRSREASTRLLARTWLDLSDPERVVLFVANGAGDRFFVRVIPLVEGFSELERESLGTILDSVVEALLSGGEIGVGREAASAEIEARVGPIEPAPVGVPEPVPDPPPPPLEMAAPAAEPGTSTPLRLTLLASYRTDLFADGPEVRHAPGIALALTGFERPELDLRLRLELLGHPPLVLGDAALGVSLVGGGWRATMGATGYADPLWSWSANLGGGMDIAYARPQVGAGTGLTASEAFVVLSPVVTGSASVSLRPASWFGLELALGADIDLAGHHYDVQGSGPRMSVASPWRVRPFAELAVVVTLEP